MSESKDYTTFPMIIDVANGGEVRWSEGLPFALSDHYELDVHQARAIRSSLFRRGGTRYTSSLSDVFDAARHVDSTTFPETNTEWNSERRYLFTDNRGSCYSAGLTTAFGELQTRTRGTECANGRNGIRWFAHPDGAPEALLWVAP